MIDKITIKGARQHNLKNIDIELPKNEFIVITGVSGMQTSQRSFCHGQAVAPRPHRALLRPKRDKPQQERQGSGPQDPL